MNYEEIRPGDTVQVIKGVTDGLIRRVVRITVRLDYPVKYILEDANKDYILDELKKLY